MRLAIIIPTITGREESLARVLDAYAETTGPAVGCDAELIVIRDQPSWPAACNAGFAQATGEIVHYGADDLEPRPGWFEPCVPVLAAGELPAAQCWNYSYDGAPDNACDGFAGQLTTFTRVPILTREMAERIGPWPEIIYYADNWVSDAARAHGWPTRLVAGYEFVHHWHQHGRLDGDPAAMGAAHAEYMRLSAALA